MTVLSNNAIRANNIMDPQCDRTVFRGKSYGISHCGVDVRVDLSDVDNLTLGTPYCMTMTPDGNGILLKPQQSILLGIIERFKMPDGVVGFVKDKSTWSRMGLFSAQAVLEPGWHGHLTVRMTNMGDEDISIIHGEPIVQVVFHWIDRVPDTLYDGKYQNQERGPQGPRYET